jgi:hypothetical protein
VQEGSTAPVDGPGILLIELCDATLFARWVIDVVVEWAPPTSPESDDLMTLVNPAIDQSFDTRVETGNITPAFLIR